MTNDVAFLLTFITRMIMFVDNNDIEEQLECLLMNLTCAQLQHFVQESLRYGGNVPFPLQAEDTDWTTYIYYTGLCLENSNILKRSALVGFKRAAKDSAGGIVKVFTTDEQFDHEYTNIAQNSNKLVVKHVGYSCKREGSARNRISMRFESVAANFLDFIFAFKTNSEQCLVRQCRILSSLTDVQISAVANLRILPALGQSSVVCICSLDALGKELEGGKGCAYIPSATIDNSKTSIFWWIVKKADGAKLNSNKTYFVMEAR